MPWGLRRIACAFDGRARRETRSTVSTRPVSTASWIASSTRRSARPSSPDGSGSRPLPTERESDQLGRDLIALAEHLALRPLSLDVHLHVQVAGIVVRRVHADA